MTVTTEGKFRKVRVKALGRKEYGRYRGKGKLIINDEGITIEGRHVRSIGARLGIAALLMIRFRHCHDGGYCPWLPSCLSSGGICHLEEREPFHPLGQGS